MRIQVIFVHYYYTTLKETSVCASGRVSESERKKKGWFNLNIRKFPLINRYNIYNIDAYKRECCVHCVRTAYLELAKR